MRLSYRKLRFHTIKNALRGCTLGVHEIEAIPSVYDCGIASFFVMSLRCNSRRLIRFRVQFLFAAVYSAAGASDSEAVSSVFASPEVSSAFASPEVSSAAGAASASFAASSFASASAASFASAAASATVV